MIKLLVDHNFNQRILRGIRIQMPRVDAVTAEQLGLSRADDPSLLEWAANNSRVILSHDGRTLVPFAYERMGEGKHMSGVILVPASIPIGPAIEDVLLILTCCEQDELEGQVKRLPI